MTAPILRLTEIAAHKVRGLLAHAGNPDGGLRVDITSRGCSGLRYEVHPVAQAAPQEEIVEDKGVRLFIPPSAVMFLLGSEMDYVEETFSSGFVFRNPNEKGRCGCGESFHV